MEFLDTAGIIQMVQTLVIGILVSAIIVLGGVLSVIGAGIWSRARDRHKRSLESVLIEVKLPRDNEVKIDSAEQLFSSFASMSGAEGLLGFSKVPDSVTFEIVAKPGDIRFYVGVPKKLQDMVEKQINGAYPDAHIQEVEDYNIFETEKGKVAFTSLFLKKADYLPIKFYKELPVDPLATIVSTLGKMQEGEAAAIQILITPAGDKWSKAGRAHIAKEKKKEADPETASYSLDQKELEAIENKLSKPGFSTFIRLVTVSSTKEAADAHLSNIVGAFTQFNSFNSFTKHSPKFYKGSMLVDFIYRHVPLLKKGSVLTSEELATIFHFPNKSIENPHINWLAARTAPAPAKIPTEGLYLGKSIYRSQEKKVYIGRDDRRRHMYIIGKTGVGKSEFLKDMILQDIRNGEGVCFIDPHDTIDMILPLIPPERAEDVILFDPSDTERPMGMNMLDANTEDQKHFVTSSIINLFYKLYDPQRTGIIGPRFEHAVRNAMLTVMSEPGNTFVELVRALTDQSYVQKLLPKVDDPIVRRYWTDQIAQTSDFHKSEVLDYITSKFGRFVTNKMMRNIIGQSKSSFDFRQVMDEGKILLISLAKGRIGEENSSFLGLLMVPKILVAAMSRQDIPQDQRRDFFLYVDEFQNFATPDFAQILSEARKYRLNLTVANQFIGQIDEEVKNAIFGNVGTIAAFRVGVSDANYLQHEFQPTFAEADLINIERFHAYVKTLIDGEPTTPFSMDLTRDITAEKKMENPRVAELIKELSRLKYGRAREVVEEEINSRSNLDIPPPTSSALPGLPRR